MKCRTSIAWVSSSKTSNVAWLIFLLFAKGESFYSVGSWAKEMNSSGGTTLKLVLPDGPASKLYSAFGLWSSILVVAWTSGLVFIGRPKAKDKGRLTTRQKHLRH